MMSRGQTRKHAAQAPIAIIGMGCMFPKAESLGAYWANIKNGVDAITEIPATHWKSQDFFDKDPNRTDHTYVKQGGFLPTYNFDPFEFGIPPSTIEATDTSQLLGMVVAKQALLDAGYGIGREFDRERVSVLLGVTGALELVIPLGARLGHPIWRKALKQSGVQDSVAEEVVRRISNAYVGWQEASFPGLLGNVVAGRIANSLDLHGTNTVVDAACASSLSAIHVAMLELAYGHCDMAISGGIDTFNDIFMYMCFSKTPALSPSGDARVFDVQGDGTTIGEGLGVVVLKRLDDAKRDGDKVYAIIRGIGSSSDGKGKAIYEPCASGQARALRQAYQFAAVTPDTIELVEAHGTGTAVGDAIEVKALTEIYRLAKKKGTWCALGSVKSQIGHTKAAAGVAGLIKAVLALHHKVLPPTIKVTRPLDVISPGVTPFYVNTVKRPWLPRSDHPRRAAVSAFGFGGSNFHCVLEEYGSDKETVDWDGNVQIIPFSAESPEALSRALGNWPVDLDWKDVRIEAARRREGFDVRQSHRLVCIAERDRTDMGRLLTNAQKMLDKRPWDSWGTSESGYYAVGQVQGKLGILFSGQGSQYVGMLRDLACLFPELQEVLTETDFAFSSGNEQEERLSDYIYPHPAFSKDKRARQETSLQATQVAQPAIGAVSLGALRVLERFGIRPDAVAGHSYGELVALCAAGCLDAKNLHFLSKLRGELMAAGKSDKGSMIAVESSLGALEEMIREEELHLVIANKNTPMQSVLSGFTKDIERAEDLFRELNIRYTRLPVSAAFHSSLVSKAQRPFQLELGKLKLSRAKIPVFSNSTGDMYPSDLQQVRKILGQQLVRPVEFVREIENMNHWGIRTFLEVGPGARLTGMVREILGEHRANAIALDVSEGRRFASYDLGRALAQLVALGHPVKLTEWDGDVIRQTKPSQKKRGMTIPICGANYVSPEPERHDPVREKSVPDIATVSSEQEHTEERAARTVPRSIPIPPDKARLSKTPHKISDRPTKGVMISNDALSQAFQATQENMTALQKMQEETARLHRQFLEGQEKAQQTLQNLLEQQQHIFEGTAVSSQATDISRVETTAPKDKTAPVVQEPTELESQAEIPIQTTMFDPEQVTRILVEAVAEKTGYPVEMLHLDMGLDTELGIDSIKRVEILSVVQEKLPGAPKVKPEHIKSLKTLRDIVSFLSRTKEAPTTETARQEPLVKSALTTEAPLSGERLERKALVRAELDAKTKREKVEIKADSEIWITEDDAGLAELLADKLRDMSYRPSLISLAELARHKVPSTLGGLIIISPVQGADDLFLKHSFQLLRKTSLRLRRAGKRGGSFFGTVSRLDGKFGIEGLDEESNPITGGLAGLAKTAQQEWPDVACKALDVDRNIQDPQGAVAVVVDEIFHKGPVEVAISDRGRCELQLMPVVLETAKGQPPIDSKDVIVISGGARGVTAEVAVALAENFHPKLILLGRSPEPVEEPKWLQTFRDEAEIKKGLVAHQSGGFSSPKELEIAYQRTVSQREIRRNIERIQAAGSEVIYHSVDVRDEEAVQAILDEVRRDVGPITGLIHGAGAIADRLIGDKTDNQFDQVYSTKVVGLRSLLHAVEDEELKIFVLFSSTTARFGRTGQVDYAVANEVLNKVAEQERSKRPNCHVVSLNWGPWDGGMVTPELKKVFAGEGISLIPLAGGASYLIKELVASSRDAAELVVMAPSSKREAELWTGPRYEAMQLAFQRELDVEHHTFLKSHVIDDHAVLPTSIIIEWLTHGALHNNPGLVFRGFNDLRILKGLILDPGHPCSISVLSEKSRRVGSEYFVPVEMHSQDDDGNKRLHARAEIILIERFPEQVEEKGKISSKDMQIRRYARNKGALYKDYLFQGPDLQGIEKVEGYSAVGIIAMTRPSPAPVDWIDQPLRNTWLADPLALDCSFQMMILWSFEQHHAGSLPTGIHRYRQFCKTFPKDGVRIVAQVVEDHHNRARADIEFFDRDKRLVARMEGYECVIDESLNKAFHHNRLPQAALRHSKAGRHAH